MLRSLPKHLLANQTYTLQAGNGRLFSEYPTRSRQKDLRSMTLGVYHQKWQADNPTEILTISKLTIPYQLFGAALLNMSRIYI